MKVVVEEGSVCGCVILWAELRERLTWPTKAEEAGTPPPPPHLHPSSSFCGFPVARHLPYYCLHCSACCLLWAAVLFVLTILRRAEIAAQPQILLAKTVAARRKSFVLDKTPLKTASAGGEADSNTLNMKCLHMCSGNNHDFPAGISRTTSPPPIPGWELWGTGLPRCSWWGPLGLGVKLRHSWTAVDSRLLFSELMIIKSVSINENSLQGNRYGLLQSK